MQVIICVLLVIGFAIYGLSVFMKITVIEVSGTMSYTDEEIITASGIAIGDNLLFLNTGRMTNSILAALPFINEVRIIRMPPDSIRIEVTESIEIAAVSIKNNIFIIDSNSKVLRITDEIPAGLIEIKGVELLDVPEGDLLKSELGAETHLLYMKDVLKAIEREGIQSDISYLDVSNITYIHFGYINRFRVILGGPSNVRGKLERLSDHVVWVNTNYSPEETGDIHLIDPNDPKFYQSN